MELGLQTSVGLADTNDGSYNNGHQWE